MATQGDIEKNLEDGRTSTPYHALSTASDEKREEPSLAPRPASFGVGLAPISSRRSHLSHTSALSRTRSYVDGHGHYIPPEDDQAVLEKTIHAYGATNSPSPSSQESGKDIIEVTWDAPDDPMNPKNLPTARKWLIVITLALGSMCVTCTSSIYTTIYTQMDREFHSSRIEATLGLSMFLFGLGISPMFLGPLSEFYGRRIIYICSYVFFTIWLIPCATAQNIQTMLIARFLGGFSGSAFLSVAGGTVGDMFTRDQLQAPMMIYTASPFLGPGFGPVAGGLINSFTNWRWTFYVLLIWSGIMLVAVTLIVPETYAPVLLRVKARRKRAETGDERYKAPLEIHERSILSTVVHSLYRPFLLLALEPMVTSLCLFSSILLGILYLFFGAFDLVFMDVYGFNLWQAGLTFIGIMTGMLVAIASDPFWHWNYIRLLRKHNAKLQRQQQQQQQEQQPEEIPPSSPISTQPLNTLHSEPEMRLPPSILGGPLATLGLFLFAWTIYPSVHWIVPLIGAAFFGCGIILVFSGVFTFLVEAFPLYAASALGANSFSRSMFAGAFPLFGVQMYERLGFHWATSLLGFLCLMCVPFPWLFWVYGKRLRAKSRFGTR